ncbi:MAG TPA: methyltransferase domain-containing protein [Acidimicrobiales bacterium]|nr:methyltransferase domain-containing protein [Acidimicrobiales bacterium]
MDETRLHELIGKAVTELSVAESAPLIYIGDKLGLYRVMAGAGPLTSQELADRSATHERYVREWLNNQAASGIVEYHPADATYELSDESAQLWAHEDSPAFLAGWVELIASLWGDADRLADAFRSGDGIGWGDHDQRLYRGVQRFFAPLYRNSLVQEWIPSLDGVEAKLREGAKVADVGCGYGLSTIIMAQAYPRSTFVGYDNHPDSITAAEKAAAEAGVADRVRFEVADAASFGGTGYDLVCFFDALHDMGDPVGAAAHALATLADGGTVMLVEPNAGDRVEDNLNAAGRAYYAGSTFLCTPGALAQPGGYSLGAQAGPERLGEVLRQAGFTRRRVTVATPFNQVLEARR